METMFTYFRSMNWVLFVNLVLFSLLMQGSRSLVDFWLKSEVTPDDHKFDWTDKYFGSFSGTYLFFIMLNFGITAIRMFVYVVSV